MMFKRILTALVAASAIAGSAHASDNFQRISDLGQFVQATQGKNLMLVRPFFLRDSVQLEVAADGGISGTALRQPVAGAWRWENGYFCRDLQWGARDLGPNCQVVERSGNEIRFIADFGEGRAADFRAD